MKRRKHRKNSGWGGARENAGRKSIWNNKETCTMRIPQIFARRLHEIAQIWDKGGKVEIDIQSKPKEHEYVSESNFENPEQITNSYPPNLDNATESKSEYIPQLSEAIELAKQILNQNKSARISLARFLSRFYDTQVRIEDLK
jgi:hypothetical protein